MTSSQSVRYMCKRLRFIILTDGRKCDLFKGGWFQRLLEMLGLEVKTQKGWFCSSSYCQGRHGEDVLFTGVKCRRGGERGRKEPPPHHHHHHHHPQQYHPKQQYLNQQSLPRVWIYNRPPLSLTIVTHLSPTMYKQNRHRAAANMSLRGSYPAENPTSTFE